MFTLIGIVTAENTEDGSCASEATVEQADVIVNVEDVGSTKTDKKKKTKKKRKMMNDTQNGSPPLSFSKLFLLILSQSLYLTTSVLLFFLFLNLLSVIVVKEIRISFYKMCV